MLAKLMKYEIKATARWFLPLYVSILFFAILNKLIFINPLMNKSAISDNDSFLLIVREIISSLSMFIYVVLLIGIFVATLIVVIQRFYKNLLGSEGYLMFTLPVKSWQHIINKLFVAMLWSIVSLLVAFCSIIILIPNKDLTKIPYALAQIMDFFGTSGIVITLLFAILTLIHGILKIYTAISLGHLFNKHKLLLSFAMYLGLDTISQFVSFLTIAIVAKAAFVPFDDILEGAVHHFKYFLTTATAITAVFSVAYFILTGFIIKRKLNLE